MTGDHPAAATVLTIGVDHPALAGHFPGRPIVPGVLLLDEALHAIELSRGSTMTPAPTVRRWRLAAVKFLHPVIPPATLSVHHAMASSGAIEFTIDDGARTVASGRVDVIEESAR